MKKIKAVFLISYVALLIFAAACGKTEEAQKHSRTGSVLKDPRCSGYNSLSHSPGMGVHHGPEFPAHFLLR